MSSNYIYDIETYPNCFSLGAEHYESGTRYCFEVSDRRDDSTALLQWLTYLHDHGCNMVGFNNVGFDYPVVHQFIRRHRTAALLYQKAMAIIQSTDRFAHTIWPSDRLVNQVDLFLIHHMDNRARRTSLKALEFNMRMESIEDLPIPPGTVLTPHQCQTLIDYMMHDVDATVEFYRHSLEAIRFRETLSARQGVDCTNYNDTKIGKKYFIQRLEESGVPCFQGREPRQTLRTSVQLGEIMLPFIGFSRPELTDAMRQLQETSVSDTSSKLGVSAEVDGFNLDFGLGGIHGSVKSEVIVSDDERAIIDVDVTSYYPSIPIAHRIYPEHLSEAFCDIFADLKQERLRHKKGTAENAMLKLALNGAWGDSGSPYSPFYDIRYMLSVTINGQLMLAMLIEWVLEITGLRMVQANTDGITVSLPRSQVETFRAVCRTWEQLTRMDLEHAEYSRMWVRDVNNYMAEKTDGSLKQIGAYVTELGPGASNPQWHKDHSAMVVPKVACRVLQHGGDVEDLLATWHDNMDFMMRQKVRRSDQLWWGDQEVQRTTRYYVCAPGFGAPMHKVMPFTAQRKAQTEASCVKLEQRIKDWEAAGKTHLKGYRCAVDDLAKKRKQLATGGGNTAVCAGHNVQVCNHMRDATAPVSIEYYAHEVRKLTGHPM